VQTTPHHTTQHSNIQHTTTAYVTKDQEGASPRVSYNIHIHVGYDHRILPPQGASPVMATTEKWLQQPAHPFSHFDLPTPQSTGTRRGTGLILAYTFSSFLFNGHPGEDINDDDHHGEPTGWAGLGWIGLDFGLVWGVWIICSRGMKCLGWTR
jgi:hypothetical protein